MINRVIILISLCMVLISGTAAAIKTAGIHSEGNGPNGSTVEDIEAGMQDGIFVTERLNELKQLSDKQNQYDEYISYYNTTTNLNNEIASLRKKFLSDIDEMQQASQTCLDRISEFEGREISSSTKKTELEILEQEQCFSTLDTAARQCLEDKEKLENAIASYKKSESSSSDNKSNKTNKPTAKPSGKPTVKPTAKPTTAPTAKPTTLPTAKPSVKSTAKPVPPTKPQYREDSNDRYDDERRIDDAKSSSSSDLPRIFSYERSAANGAN